MPRREIVYTVDDQTRKGVQSLDRNLSKAEQRATSLGGAAKRLGPVFAAGAGAAVAAGAAIVGSVTRQARQIDNLSTVSQIGAERLQAMGIVAERSGGSIEDVADASREMQLRLAEAVSLGTGPAIDALDLLGVSLEDLQDLRPEAQFEALRDRLSEVEDPALRAFAAEELLGGASERLAETIALSADEFDRQTQAAAASGQVLSEETVTATTRAGDAIARLGEQARGLAGDLVGAVAPAVTAVAEGLSDLLGWLSTTRVGMDDLAAAADRQTLGWGRYVVQVDDTTSALDELVAGYAAVQAEHPAIIEGLYAEADAHRAAAAAAQQQTRDIAALQLQLSGGIGAGFAADARAAYQARVDADLAHVAGLSDLPGELYDPGVSSDAVRLLVEDGYRQVITDAGREWTREITGSRGVGGTTSAIVDTADRDLQVQQDQLDRLYADGRLTEAQYEALLASNDLTQTLADLTETASSSELAALDTVRASAYRAGDLTAEGSRQIVGAIATVRAAIASQRTAAAGRRGGVQELTGTDQYGFGRVFTRGNRIVAVSGRRRVGASEEDLYGPRSRQEYIEHFGLESARPEEIARHRNTQEGRAYIGQFDDVPHLARGGVVTRPTLAMIGEAGPEAVVPLPRAPQPMHITLMLDGSRLAQWTIGTVNRGIRRGDVTVDGTY